MTPTLATAYAAANTTFPALAMPKLNGIRCYATGGKLFTRNGREITSLPHLAAAVANLPGTVDGELFTADLSFEALAGIVRSKQPCKQSCLVKYYLFDQTGDAPYQQRLEVLRCLLLPSTSSGSVVVVESYPCQNDAEAQCRYREFLQAGYEGAIIRNPDAPYIEGRSAVMQKMKPVNDAEFIITRAVSPGVWECKTDCGQKFKVQMKSKAYAANEKAFLHPRRYLGKPLTVEFNGYTGHNIPRHARGVAVRAYE